MKIRNQIFYQSAIPFLRVEPGIWLKLLDYFG